MQGSIIETKKNNMFDMGVGNIWFADDINSQIGAEFTAKTKFDQQSA